ncbi:MAG TPA: DUF2442 domain-containing protein [Longimicrobium sp.]|jgi:hypothetical protein
MAAEWAPPADEELLAQVAAAREHGRLAAEVEPRAVSARCDAATGWTILQLANGCIFAFPPDVDSEVSALTPEQRARVRVFPGGSGLYWEGTDATLSIPGLLGGEHRPWLAPEAGESPAPRRRRA